MLPDCLREYDRLLGLWRTRLDVTVRQIKVKDLLFPASSGAYSIVSHPPKIAAGWGSLGRDGAWAGSLKRGSIFNDLRHD